MSARARFMGLANKTSTKLFIESGLLFFGGATVLVRGKVWDIDLGTNKYMVAGIVALFGIALGVVAWKARLSGK